MYAYVVLANASIPFASAALSLLVLLRSIIENLPIPAFALDGAERFTLYEAWARMTFGVPRGT